MKKTMSVLLAVIAVLTMTLSLASCSKKEYTDTPVDAQASTEIVTDENGETVTDENGKVVTKEITSSAENNTTEKNGKEETTEKKTEKSDKTTKASTGKTTEKSTAKKTTTSTTKLTTTEKPKKREVTVTVQLPYYNNETHDMTVYYKLPKDEKYTKLEPQEVVLDGSEVKVKLGKLKGDVKVIVKLSDMNNISDNTATVKSNENSCKIVIVTGIEMLDGGMD